MAGQRARNSVPGRPGSQRDERANLSVDEPGAVRGDSRRGGQQRAAGAQRSVEGTAAAARVQDGGGEAAARTQPADGAVAVRVGAEPAAVHWREALHVPLPRAAGAADGVPADGAERGAAAGARARAAVRGGDAGHGGRVLPLARVDVRTAPHAGAAGAAALAAAVDLRRRGAGGEEVRRAAYLRRTRPPHARRHRVAHGPLRLGQVHRVRGAGANDVQEGLPGVPPGRRQHSLRPQQQPGLQCRGPQRKHPENLGGGQADGRRGRDQHVCVHLAVHCGSPGGAPDPRQGGHPVRRGARRRAAGGGGETRPQGAVQEGQNGRN
ncbi:Adenylyl-sulfate kinase APSK [Gracilaria domingensis]|nr:Adenylyl-sulfate kinase APSK [Gracilaria domingensis]